MSYVEAGTGPKGSYTPVKGSKFRSCKILSAPIFSNSFTASLPERCKPHQDTDARTCANSNLLEKRYKKGNIGN